MEIIRYSDISVRDLINQRSNFPEKDKMRRTINEVNIKRVFKAISKTERTEAQIGETIAWLEKISEYVPIPSEKELEEIIKLMIMLSEVRARLNFLYDKPGLNLMKRVRECMIRYLIVLSEIRAQREEYFTHWFTDESWIFDWSRVILDLSPSDNMEKYAFLDLTAHDFLFLLALELACADSTSKLDSPMIRMQAMEGKSGSFIIIPTDAAAKEYQIQVSKILNEELTFAEWVDQTLAAYKLP
ncbi:MAG: hypothetical protein JSU57_05500 [Candidatus Heimdallarchaeota archaeon]|nr:MAG: hypothetical protein JSU57_05500 [Candidatus Heimdallarchaeota archaeon]